MQYNLTTNGIRNIIKYVLYSKINVESCSHLEYDMHVDKYRISRGKL